MDVVRIYSASGLVVESCQLLNAEMCFKGRRGSPYHKGVQNANRYPEGTPHGVYNCHKCIAGFEAVYPRDELGYAAEHANLGGVSRVDLKTCSRSTTYKGEEDGRGFRMAPPVRNVTRGDPCRAGETRKPEGSRRRDGLEEYLYSRCLVGDFGALLAVSIACGDGHNGCVL